MKCRVEANNNREAVIVCAPHVVKRSSKRSPLVYTVNSRYNQVGFNEITAYNQMEISPRGLNALIISGYNEYPDITNEFTGPKHFVITRVRCIRVEQYDIKRHENDSCSCLVGLKFTCLCSCLAIVLYIIFDDCCSIYTQIVFHHAHIFHWPI